MGPIFNDGDGWRLLGCGCFLLLAAAAIGGLVAYFWLR